MKRLTFFAQLTAVALIFLPVAGIAKNEAKPQVETAMKVIKSNKDLSKFADLIEEAELQSMFDDKTKTMTVFAPSNEALSKAPSDIMKKAKSDKQKMQNFIKYHVLNGSLVSFSDMKGRTAGVAMANSETVVFDGRGEKVKISNAEIVTPNIPASNGLVHVINSAMTPPSFVEIPKEDLEKRHREMEERMREMEKKREKKMRERGIAPLSTEVPESADGSPAEPSAPTGDGLPGVEKMPPQPMPAMPSAPIGKKSTKEEKGIKGWLKKLGW